MNCYFSHCQLISIQNGKVERAWLFIPDQDSDSFLTVQLRVSCKLTHCPERLLYRVARIGGRRPAQCPHTPSMRASPLSLSAHQQRALLHICNWTVTLEHCTDCVLLLSQLKRCFIFWVLFTHFFSCSVSLCLYPSWQVPITVMYQVCHVSQCPWGGLLVITQCDLFLIRTKNVLITVN